MSIKRLFILVNRWVYQHFGAGLSTSLAHSLFGKFIFQLFNENKGGLAVYEAEGIKLKLYPDEALNLGIIHLGTINPYETQIIKQIIKPGNVFIDVGGFVDGWHGLLASKLAGLKGKVIIFEPTPDFYQRLIINASLNKFKNIIIENLALSTKDGKRKFYQGDGASSFFYTHTNKHSLKPVREITVKTTSLDSYLTKHNIAKVDLIKIDVEGSEMEVIKGGINLFKRKTAPDIIIEVVNDFLQSGQTSEKQLIDLFSELDYVPYAIKDGKITQYNHNKYGLLNLFFSKRKQLF